MKKLEVLKWLLRETFEPDQLQSASILEKHKSAGKFTNF